MHFNSAASSYNPTPALPCKQGREPSFVQLRFDALGKEAKRLAGTHINKEGATCTLFWLTPLRSPHGFVSSLH